MELGSIEAIKEMVGVMGESAITSDVSIAQALNQSRQ